MSALSRPEIRGVHLVLASACNLDCSYCYQGAKTGRGMTRGVLDAAVEIALASTRSEVKLVFSGGEPLLEFPLLRRAVARVEASGRQGRNIRFVVSTNGLLLDDRKAAFLAEHEIETQISFDGVRGAQDLRAPGTFDQLDALLRRLRMGLPLFFERQVKVSATVTSLNLRYLPPSIRYFLDLGIEDIRIGPTYTHDRYWRPGAIRLLDRQFQRMFDLSLEHFRDTGRVPLGLVRREKERGRGPKSRPRCAASVGDVLTVGPEGRTFSCPMLSDAYPTRSSPFQGECVAAMSLGDLRDPAFPSRLAALPDAARRTGLFDGWRSKRSSHARCGDCRFFASCSVCPVSIAYASGGDVRRVPDLPCAFSLVSNTWRERFPAMPGPEDILTGRAPLPRKVQELSRAVAGFGGATPISVRSTPDRPLSRRAAADAARRPSR